MNRTKVRALHAAPNAPVTAAPPLARSAVPSAARPSVAVRAAGAPHRAATGRSVVGGGRRAT